MPKPCFDDLLKSALQLRQDSAKRYTQGFGQFLVHSVETIHCRSRVGGKPIAQDGSITPLQEKTKSPPVSPSLPKPLNERYDCTLHSS